MRIEASSRSETRAVLARYRGALVTVGALSAAVNLLMLTGPLFMLQIYDRVLTSRSEATLVALLAIVVYLYGLKGLLDGLRGRILSRVGAGIQAALDERVFDASERAARGPGHGLRSGRELGELETVRTFLASPAPGAILDLPWTPFFLAVIFVFHPLLGWLAVGGGSVLLVLALVNRWATKAPQELATALSADAERRAEDMRRQADTVRSLGMSGPLRGRWKAVREAALDRGMRASDAGGGLTSASKAFRLLLQSGMLALGAWLVLHGELTPGAMIAASILLGRALQPLEQTIAQSALIQRARAGWLSVSQLLATTPLPPRPMSLPRPEAELRVRDLAVPSPDRRHALLQGVSFDANPGEAVAVVGPSGAGKSTLAKALAGLWPPAHGEIRFGGAELSSYGDAFYRNHLGYLPQEVVLFAGSVAENIARFDQGASEEAVVRAAMAAGAHEMILTLPDTYDTLLEGGSGGVSGGQRQRIGLARALYDDPALLVLDEPDASLDDAGTEALNRAISQAKAAGRTVVVMAHRRPVLAECARILVLEGGRMQLLGPSDKVLPRIPGYRRPQLAAVGERGALAGAGEGKADSNAAGDADGN
ncbi:MAG: type I secretion system permease/ATPase [Boseongicola sp. SB0677_bin_26]|nr:type I secretion system permease/ATPase [Boseongicola sp. SB0677_bin_26]